MPADGTFDTFTIPNGVLFVAPGNSPATSYNAATATWTTFVGVTSGATSLSTITFITAGVYALPPLKSVRRCASLNKFFRWTLEALARHCT